MDVVAFAEHDIVCRVDAIVGVSRDREGTAAVEEQLALAVERPLVTTPGAVSQCVGGAVSQDDEGTFATQEVESSRVGVGNAHAAEFDSIFLVTHHRQRTIGDRPAHHVADALGRAMVDCHVTAVDRHLHPIICLGDRVGEVYCHFGRE